MKRLLLLLLAALPLSGAAQESDVSSFLVEGKTWVTCLFGGPTGYVRVDEKCLHGDTIIDGIHFMRVYNRYYDYGAEPPQEWIPQKQLIGQDGTRLYRRYEERLAGWYPEVFMFMDLDFTKVAGDSIPTETREGGPWLYDVVSVTDTLLSNSTDLQQRKCMSVKCAWRPYTEDIWIEGIGSVTTGITDDVLGLYVGGFSQLTKCYVGDEVLYEHEFDKMTPMQIALGISSQRASSRHGQALYDLQGRRVEGQPRRGLYIQQGRKRVMR